MATPRSTRADNAEPVLDAGHIPTPQPRAGRDRAARRQEGHSPPCHPAGPLRHPVTVSAGRAVVVLVVLKAVVARRLLTGVAVVATVQVPASCSSPVTEGTVTFVPVGLPAVS